MAEPTNNDETMGDDPFDRGLAAAFGPDSEAQPRASALTALWSGRGEPPRILLRDAPGDDTPISRPGSPEMPETPPDAGRYQLLGEIARGGMGAVLKGRDPDLGRDLAVKILLEKHRERPEVVRRFVEEAQIGGQLQHPGIVPVYELGTFADHRPYFTMKLVKGRTLAALLAERKEPSHDLPRFLSIFEAVCQTVAYAHARGVIHRDLKPSNVMVGSFGEVQVMDWGLAKVLPAGGIADEQAPGPEVSLIETVRSGSDADASHAGSVLGTPGYMAPEQARGEVAAIGARVDVFGLGSILCEILTGRPAFIGRSGGETLRLTARGDLSDAFARFDRCGADAELIALASACLAPEPADRPADAGAVNSRMTAYLTGVQERLRRAELDRVEAQARAVEEAKRRKLTVALAASVLALVGLGVSGWAYVEAGRRDHERRVLAAYHDADAKAQVARRSGDDLAAWAAAREAARGARAMLTGGRLNRQLENQVVILADKVDHVYALTARRIEAARRDRALMDALANARSARGEVGASATSDAYARALKGYGLDLAGAEELAPMARRVAGRPEAIRVELAAALDDWAILGRELKQPESDVARRVALAQRIDPAEARDAMRRAWLGHDEDAIRQLADSEQSGRFSPASLALLAAILAADGDRPKAVKLLRRGLIDHPRDVWLNFDLARHLSKMGPEDRTEAIGYYQVARALRPETGHDLAHLLDERGRSEEAEGVFRELTRLRPDDARHLGCLGRLLKDRGQPGEATAVLDRAISAGRAAIRLRPDNAADINNLGLALRDRGRLDEAVAALGTAIRLNPADADAHNNLAVALKAQGKLDEAVAAHRQAIRLKPDYAEAHHCLGVTLYAQGDLGAAIDEFRTAIRLKPDLALTHNELGVALQMRGELDAAIGEFHTTIRLMPGFSAPHNNLGTVLHDKGQIDEAMREYREAIRLQANNAEAHSNLGLALRDKGQLDAAIDEFRAAIHFKPDLALAHNGLGAALLDKGQLDAAIDEHRTAIRLQPGDVDAYNNLGNALAVKGQSEAAIDQFRTAIRMKPDLAEPHLGLGNVLKNQQQIDAAIKEYRTAISLKPGLSNAHNGLGAALLLKGQIDAAIDELRTAVQLKPDFFGHFNLGMALQAKGHYADALRHLRSSYDQLGPDDPRRPAIAAQLHLAERTARLADRLPAVVRGEDEPADAAERLTLGEIAYNRSLHGAASHLYDEALAADPKLANDPADGNRYNAACCAALAGSGQGKDDPPLDDAARARWREKAREWLKADLDAWAKILEGGPPQARAAIVPTLRHWKEDADLAGLRDEAELAKLPEDERSACEALWAEVAALLKKSEAP